MRLQGFVKNLPAPVRALIQPMWYLSVGLHGLLLMMPMPSTTDAKPSARKKETVKLAKLSVPPVPRPSPVVKSPLPSPVVQQSPVVPTLPQVKPQPPKANAIMSQPLSSLVVQPNTPIPSPIPLASATPSPSPIPIASPSPSPTPIASPSPSPSPSPIPIASPILSPSPIPIASPSPSPTPTNPFAGIPELAGVKQGCNGQQQCWQVEGSNIRSVASNGIEPFLKAQGYTLLGQEDIADDTGRNLYRVSNKNGEIEYLHLISTDNGPVLLLGEKDLTREELMAKAAS